MQLLESVLQFNAGTHPLTPNQTNSFPELYVNYQYTNEGAWSRYSIFIHPKMSVLINKLELHFSLEVADNTRFLNGGYQSWSETRWVKPGQPRQRLKKIARPAMGWYGDQYFLDLPEGVTHSWTYAMFQSNSERLTLLGSLTESTGFTRFFYNPEKKVLTVSKELNDLLLSHSFPALDLWVGSGPARKVWDAYAAEWQVPVRIGHPAVGWNSWYRYFNKITATKLEEDCISFAGLTAEIPTDTPRYFQIDDGWQQEIGDWMPHPKRFPQGLSPIAATATACGLTPGIWIAPFIAAKHSQLMRQHPDWIMKDRKGQPVRVGWNPLWRKKGSMPLTSGWYYALDPYHPGVKGYLTAVFLQLGSSFELFKLDFLFAACLAPPEGKTRGQVMQDALQFLRRCLGDRKIIACGVPLGAAIGLADYCRIGGDVSLQWDNPLMRFLGHREMTSTLGSLRNTLSRWELNRRLLGSDPDVFVLRKQGHQLSPLQQETLLLVNALLGQALFTSDDTGSYTSTLRNQFYHAVSLLGSTIYRVEMVQEDVYLIEFQPLKYPNRQYARVNLNNHSIALNQENGEKITLAAGQILLSSN
jgi:alpha-galactosidase